MAKHSLIFIHGMGVGNPDKEYDQLWELIAKHYEKIHHLDSGQFNQIFKLIPINYREITFEAKKKIFELAFPNMNADGIIKISDILHPINGLRDFITFFLGDVTAYVAEYDNNIRSTFWEQVKTAVVNSNYSIISYSLGSIVAFDFLYNLLEECEFFLPIPDGGETEEFRHERKEFYKNLNKIQGNFRHFFTFGSTIGLFMMRKGTLWKNNASFSKIINPVHLLDEQNISHTWLNFYDNQDILSYPLENLFKQNQKNANRSLEDIEIQTGDLVLNSHTGYWKNKEMAAHIAKTLPTEDTLSQS